MLLPDQPGCFLRIRPDGRLGVEEESPGVAASALEFALEGLHLHQKLNKDREGGRYTYRA